MINFDEVDQFCEIINYREINNGILYKILYYYLRKNHLSVINCDFYYYN